MRRMRVTSDDCAGASARHVLPPVPWLILITLELDFVVSVDLGATVWNLLPWQYK